MSSNSQPAGNIILIGMPAVGKSTVGVLLAKRLSKAFIDTDVSLQRQHGMSLREFMDLHGVDAFRRAETECVLSIACEQTVIATGGSVIYSEASMQHLRSLGRVVFLDIEVGALEARIDDLDRRGVVRAPGQSLRELYTERLPLYRHYADVTVECTDKPHESVVDQIVGSL